MRALLLCLALLALVPLAAAQGARFRPDWQVGPASFTYDGHEVRVPEGVSYASDGATYLYGSDEDPETLASTPEHCDLPGDGATTPWVLVQARSCTAGAHPGVSCAGTDICLLGRAPPGGGGGLAPGGGRFVARDGWTQFVPDWQRGPATIAWRGADVHVPANVSYATDGTGWLYGSRETPEELGGEHDCVLGDDETAVVLSVTRCSLARHPSIACFATDLCDTRLGQTPPGGPPVTSTLGFTPTTPMDSCGRYQALRCTPAPALGGVLLMLAGAALIARGRGRA